ncbi:hypothetical protein [Rhizobium sp. RAF56]|uniref:hypothetical protein n=1 Tax=Rhizobium sp. RAF56 TaxID=3233062 RepID=UPI003F9AC324
MKIATSSKLAAEVLKPYPAAAMAIGDLERPIPLKILETLLRLGLLPPEVVPMLGSVGIAPHHVVDAEVLRWHPNLEEIVQLRLAAKPAQSAGNPDTSHPFHAGVPAAWPPQPPRRRRP